MSNDIFPNKFKAALAAKEIQIGCWSALASPISTEVLGLAGFDWLVLDGEHAPNDISTFIPQLMALKGSHSAPVVRVPTNEPVIIKRLLDIGFYNFLIPFVESEEEAVQAVASTRYPPEGIRGVSVSHRANMFGTVPDYLAQSNKNITILVQIESQQGVDNLDAIAATEGVDGIFVGPSDLAAAFGMITHTILHSAEDMVTGLSTVAFINVMYWLEVVLSFLVPSSSGLAVLTMPIMAPLADFANVNRDLVVTAYQSASGIVNLVTPTSAVVMGGLAIARIPYVRYLKWVAPLLGILTVVIMVALSLGALM
jgi:2-dehydro-3-deoxyglucarate aldolase